MRIEKFILHELVFTHRNSLFRFVMVNKSKPLVCEEFIFLHPSNSEIQTIQSDHVIGGLFRGVYKLK